MLSRRQLLTGLAAAPLFASPAPVVSRIELIEEGHSIAAESVRGYRSLRSFARNPKADLILVPGMRNITPEMCSALLRRVHSGAILVVEGGLCFSPLERAIQQRKILREGLGLEILPPFDTHSYVSYSWPVPKLVRSFQAVTPVVCNENEVIASSKGTPVCLKRPAGKGYLVYLGSMLGPGLAADEREAHEVGDALLWGA